MFDKKSLTPKPYFSIILAAVIWGSAGPFIKYLALPPIVIAFIRLAVPALALLPYLYFSGTTINLSKGMLIASVLFTLWIFLYVVGFTYASIGGAVIMLYTWPIFMSILAIPMTGEHLDYRSGLLLIAAFIGILFVYGEANFSLSNKNFIGLSAMLLGSIILAITNLIFRNEMAKHSEFEVVFLQNLVGTILFIPLLLVSNYFPTPNQIFVGSIYAFLIGVVAFSLFYSGLKKLRIVKAASLSYIEVVSALFMAYIFFGEPFSWNKIIGGILIVGSAALVKK